LTKVGYKVGMTDSIPKANDWLFTLEGGYLQEVVTTFQLDEDGSLKVVLEARRTGKMSGRKSPWTPLAVAHVPNIKVNCDMWENERWSGENFLKTLHDAVMES
jgi:hypothetical protein